MRAHRYRPSSESYICPAVYVEPFPLNTLKRKKTSRVLFAHFSLYTRKQNWQMDRTVLKYQKGPICHLYANIAAQIDVVGNRRRLLFVFQTIRKQKRFHLHCGEAPRRAETRNRWEAAPSSKDEESSCKVSFQFVLSLVLHQLRRRTAERKR